MVFFNNVLVPWERVFLLGDVDLCNNVGVATQSMAHSGHQVLTRYVVKAEFILGLADLMVETLGSGSIPHVQEQVAELITHRDMLHACLWAAEVDAAPNQWGIMSPASAPLQAGRALFGRTVYPRMVEIIHLLGTSSLMALPAEADFASPLAPAVEHYLATDSATARDRAQLFHLAWDVSCSAFAGRQVLYERMFGGNAVRNARRCFTPLIRSPFGNGSAPFCVQRRRARNHSATLGGVTALDTITPVFWPQRPKGLAFLHGGVPTPPGADAASRPSGAARRRSVPCQSPSSH
jgi:4-hydroxyphenylacetate 3-monooxygenase